ncbi:MAG: plasmid stabilization protein [Sporichthyaceae bacterium]
MATARQVQAAKKNVKKAQAAAESSRTLAHLPAGTKRALGEQGAAVAQRRRTGAAKPQTRRELYDEARRRQIRGRSKMGRDELARALGRS